MSRALKKKENSFILSLVEATEGTEWYSMNDVLSSLGNELNLENIEGIVLQTGGEGMLTWEAVFHFMT